MNAVLVFLLTKTGVIRWIGNFVSAWLVAHGVVEDNAEAQVAGALVAVFTGLLTKVIETIKDHETKKTQKVLDSVSPVEVKKDGLAGPETRKAIVTAVSVASNPSRKG